MQDIANKIGKTPPRRMIKEPDESTYRDRFGSWTNAVIIAGLMPNILIPKNFDGKRRSISFSLRFKILKRDKYTCQYCGGTPKQGYVLNVDHINPVCKNNNKEYKENELITACWICNQGKGTMVAG